MTSLHTNHLNVTYFLVYILIFFIFFFFFSSRRRHTRFDCDWSSDVCSSDLQPPRGEQTRLERDPGPHCTVRGAEPVGLSGTREPSGLASGVVAGTHQCEIGRASCRERV